MAHIDFDEFFLSYNLAQIYLDMTVEDPRLGSFDIPVPLATDFILGRFFTHEISESLLITLLDNNRNISMALHPMMASRICFEQLNESRFQAQMPLLPMHRFLVQDAVCELNFFDYRSTDSAALRSLVSLLGYEQHMTDIDLGEVVFYQIYGAVLEKIKLGYVHFQIHLPQTMLNEVQFYGTFALETSL